MVTATLHGADMAPTPGINAKISAIFRIQERTAWKIQMEHPHANLAPQAHGPPVGGDQKV
jgi:hypothetical protein